MFVLRKSASPMGTLLVFEAETDVNSAIVDSATLEALGFEALPEITMFLYPASILKYVRSRS